MKQILLLFFLCNVFLARGQSVSGVVLNAETGEAVYLANIVILNRPIGISSSSNGAFALQIDSSISTNEFIKITAVGYRDTILKIAKIIHQDTIYLKPMIYQLEEVKIRPQKKKEIWVNKLDKTTKTGRLLCGNSPIINAIEYDYDTAFKETPFIEKLIIYVTKSIKKYKFNVHLYERKDSIFTELLNHNLVVTTPRKIGFGKTAIEVDISKYNILFPKTKLLVGVEWILNNDNFEKSKETEDNIGMTKGKYGPKFIITFEKKSKGWHYFEGYWKKENQLLNGYIVPAISLVLSN